MKTWKIYIFFSVFVDFPSEAGFQKLLPWQMQLKWYIVHTAGTVAAEKCNAN